MQKNAARSRARIAQALRIIKDMLRNPQLTPSLVAKQVDLDLPAFSRAFRQVTGYTCTDYIALERIRVAKRLLTKEDLLIKEIAYRVGFENANYFSRRFREMEGQTPSSFRRLNHRN
jgi:two-component system response regulator YesN